LNGASQQLPHQRDLLVAKENSPFGEEKKIIVKRG